MFNCLSPINKLELWKILHQMSRWSSETQPWCNAIVSTCTSANQHKIVFCQVERIYGDKLKGLALLVEVVGQVRKHKLCQLNEVFLVVDQTASWWNVKLTKRPSTDYQGQVFHYESGCMGTVKLLCLLSKQANLMSKKCLKQGVILIKLFWLKLLTL